MDSFFVLLVVVVGILLATGLWKDVFRGLIGGLIKFIVVILILVMVAAYFYQKFFA